ncbi:glycosyltransferase [Streptomyces sp. NPDC006365]|uniref:glycosyltransferase n=1 Tax=Streptomyces sp. NPDC006365 TaxID=3364744 RepID=UPI00367E921A
MSAAEGNAPLIWAHYLFPYGAAGLMAAGLLRGSGVPVRLWLNPAGSDIWEVGPQLRELSTGLLRDPGVDRIVTYSPSFAAELSDQYGVNRPIDVLKPCLSGRYRPLSAVDRAAARRRLGLPADAFLISMHSNMRPVKAPEDVLCVARRVAGLLDSRNVVLLLAGPAPSIPWDLSPLDIRLLGLLRDVTEVLQVSDAELNLSRHDSFNLSLAEAMACGVPVVTTDVVGIAPDIHACDAGATVPLEPPVPRDPRRCYRAAVDALCRFGSREEERSAAGRRAGEHAAAAFSGAAHWTRLRSLLSAELAGASQP